MIKKMKKYTKLKLKIFSKKTNSKLNFNVNGKPLNNRTPIIIKIDKLGYRFSKLFIPIIERELKRLQIQSTIKKK